MDIRKIKKLIELIDETGITEIEIREGEESVRLSRQGHVVDAVISTPRIQAQAPVASIAAEPLPQAVQKSNHHQVLSPMVGTFYSSRSPEAPPFAAVGKRVKQGEVLCLIEAMKMFNEIEADKSGILADILVKNGDPVEYDQPLFIIEEQDL